MLKDHYETSKSCPVRQTKVYKCEFCEKAFKTMHQKKDHHNIHTGETPYTCTYCCKTFKFRSKLYVHIYRHKLELGLTKEKESYKEKRVRLRLKCDECDKIFLATMFYR